MYDTPISTVLETGGHSDMFEFVVERAALLGSTIGVEPLGVVVLFATAILFKLMVAPALFWDMFRSYGTISAPQKAEVAYINLAPYRPLKAPMVLKIGHRRTLFTISATVIVLVAYFALWLFAFASAPSWVFFIDVLTSGFLYVLFLDSLLSMRSFELDRRYRRMKVR